MTQWLAVASRGAAGRRSRPAVASRALLAGLLALVAGCADAIDPAASDAPPNVVVILTDDQGYGDVASFGASDVATPSLDRVAREGMRLTSFYSAPTCTPSRAMLMTGSYGQRVSVPAAYYPRSREGLSPDEVTIAEVLRERGYATGLVGKWHLGDAPPFLPTRQGFDEYFGIPFSNDMGRVNPIFQPIYPDLPLLHGDEVIEREPDQSQLTRRYTEAATDFIARHADGPFLLVLAHSMPHWPIAASEQFLGSSPRGLYGDVIAEVDWSVGEVLAALERSGVDRRTLVLFASDNGPWLVFGEHAGSAGPLREGKSTSFEGGVRVPAIARWPGRIAAGSESAAVMGLIDVLPTVASLAGASLPADRVVDGRDVWSALASEGDAALRDRPWLFYRTGDLEAVRRGRWKLHLPHAYTTIVEPGVGGLPGSTSEEELGLALFDLEDDPGETRDLAASRPDVVAELQAVAEEARADLGDRLSGRVGTGVRPAGRVGGG